MIQWAILIGFNSSSMFEGKILTNLPSTFLYQQLCISVTIGKALVANQYCVALDPVILGFGQGVGSVLVQRGAYFTNFKYLTYGKFSTENVNTNLPLLFGFFKRLPTEIWPSPSMSPVMASKI